MAVIPCAPGYIWPVGKIAGFKIPTLFVDYHPANDMFFSGHAGTALVIGWELMQLEYYRCAWCQLLFILPCTCVWVIATRVHRGIDVFAGILAAIAACSISREIADSVDRLIMVHRHQDNVNKQKKKLK